MVSAGACSSPSVSSRSGPAKTSGRTSTGSVGRLRVFSEMELARRLVSGGDLPSGVTVKSRRSTTYTPSGQRTRREASRAARLAADAAADDQRPTGVPNVELTARMSAAIEQVMARATNAPELVSGSEHIDIVDALIVATADDEHEQATAAAKRVAGEVVGGGVAPHPSSIARRSSSKKLSGWCC